MVEANTSPLPLMVSLFFLIPLITCTLNAHGVHSFGEKTVLPLHNSQWKQYRVTPSNCFTHKSVRQSGATILEIQHKDYCSGPINDWNKRLQKHLIFDDIRVKSLQNRIRSGVHGQIEDLSDIRIPIISGLKLQTLNYIVTVQLGGRNMTVIVDTGSDLTWIQCQPCKLCYNQQDPLFNPSSSPSYQSVPCSSPACQSLLSATGNSGVCGTDPPVCNYAVSYGDGSYTNGELARDRLNLGATHIDDFIFGCGQDNRGLFGGASGLMGLGRSNLSLISQTSPVFGGVFSYCLPSSGAEASGSLTLGGNSSIYKNSTPVSYTRMVPNPLLSTFYFLNMTGVSIGGVALQAPGFGDGGILIDSGTVITRLAPSLYSALKAEFLKQFSGFPTAPGFSILDTCFDLSGYEEVNIPTIRMHFEGNAELNVDVTGIFYFVKTDASQVCLALASLSYEDEVAIIGNYQQRNLRVIYDSKASMVGFAKETCSFI